MARRQMLRFPLLLSALYRDVKLTGDRNNADGFKTGQPKDDLAAVGENAAGDLRELFHAQLCEPLFRVSNSSLRTLSSSLVFIAFLPSDK